MKRGRAAATRAGRFAAILGVLTVAGCALQPPADPGWRSAEALAGLRSEARRDTLAPEARAALAESDRALERSRAAQASDSLGAAADQARAAWGARREWLGTADVQTAAAALALAEAELALGHPGESDTFARAARDAFAAALGPEHPRVADAEDLLGRIVKNYSGPAEFQRALTHYEIALRIRIATEGPRSLPVAATLHNLGNLHRVVRSDGPAFGFFRRSLEIRRARLGPVHDDVASSLSAMAFLRAGQGRWRETEVLARQALAATPAGPGVPTGTRSVRLGVLGHALCRIGRAEEAVTVLREAAALRESIWVRTPRDAGSTMIAGLGLHKELAIALAVAGRGEEAFEELERGAARLLLDRLRQGPVTSDPWRGLLPRLQRTLGEDEAVVSWPRSPTTMFVPDRPMYACVVRSSGPVQWILLHPSDVPLPRLGSMREAMWGEMRAASYWPRRVDDTLTVRHLATLLWKERFAPLEPSLHGVRHLIVCSTDLMQGGPLGVLRDDSGRYLAERFRISYVPSALLFTRWREHARPPWPAGVPALLVGDPEYPAGDPGNWGRLSGSAEEIQEIARRFGNATVLTGFDARAERLRRMAAAGTLASYRVVHISAHTVVNTSRALESALVLAPDSRGDGTTSRLVAREIAEGWRLDADLVCLAGCGSVQGMPSVSDGMLGLHQAFLAAGARSLLITIWPVDDRATALLTSAFYARLTADVPPVDRAEALRQAQNALRTWRGPDGSRPYEHPAYWGGFALIGDPG